MMERRQIVRLWQQGGATVLVTLVRAEGSSYRRPGARLLLGAHGEYGGRSVADAWRRRSCARLEWLVRNGAVVERYSTMFDDTAEVPFGLGCGGVVDLLLEPADTPECRALMSALEGALRGEETTVLTWLPHDRQALSARRSYDNGGLHLCQRRIDRGTVDGGSLGGVARGVDQEYAGGHVR